MEKLSINRLKCVNSQQIINFLGIYENTSHQ